MKKFSETKRYYPILKNEKEEESIRNRLNELQELGMTEGNGDEFEIKGVVSPINIKSIWYWSGPQWVDYIDYVKDLIKEKEASKQREVYLSYHGKDTSKPLESFEGIPSIIDSVIQNHITKLQNKKEEIIKEFFTSKGYGHLLENIENKRFKKVIVERYHDREEWWADNGTDYGVLIITFLNPDVEKNVNQVGNFSTQLTITFKYF